jgi:hypothetical protein
MFGHFYNQNLRKLVVGFGALFSNIDVEHADPDNGHSYKNKSSYSLCFTRKIYSTFITTIIYNSKELVLKPKFQLLVL